MSFVHLANHVEKVRCFKKGEMSYSGGGGKAFFSKFVFWQGKSIGKKKGFPPPTISHTSDLKKKKLNHFGPKLLGETPLVETRGPGPLFHVIASNITIDDDYKAFVLRSAKEKSRSYSSSVSVSIRRDGVMI